MPAVTDGTFDTFADPGSGSTTNGFDFSNLMNQTTDVLASWAKQALDKQTVKDNGGTPVVAPSETPATNWKKWATIGGVVLGAVFLIWLLFRR